MLKSLLLRLLRALGVLIESPKKELVPEILGEISGREIDQILKGTCPGAAIYLADSNYYKVALGDLKKFLQLSQVNEIDYVAEDMDCDDFAFALHGGLSVPPWSAIPFGILWTDTHAMNVFIDENDKVWFVEPQTDEITNKLATGQGVSFRLIIM